MTQFGVLPRSSGPLARKLEAKADSKPAPPPVLYPTAMAVALAIAEAARLKGEDPISCATGRYQHQCRYTAYWALIDLYSSAPPTAIARFVGAKRVDAFVKKAERGRREFYFADEAEVDAVKRMIAWSEA